MEESKALLLWVNTVLDSPTGTYKNISELADCDGLFAILQKVSVRLDSPYLATHNSLARLISIPYRPWARTMIF